MTVTQAQAVGHPAFSQDRSINPFDEVNEFFDQAAGRLQLPDGCREMLKRPWMKLQVQVPVRMDDGEIRVFTGYRVQHNAARGPYKGSVQCEPKSLSQDELNRLTRRYTINVSHLPAPQRDIPAPDMGTNA